jgi:DNA helicase-2/ATP-dependent DNA helicase PcrA
MTTPSATESPLTAGLNPQQREAVLATEGAVLILAGAGSGKTRVITHRIAHLVLEKGVPSEQILAVTFTNKAAGELKTRIEGLLGGALRGWVSTFHSLCVRILRREAAAAGLPRDFLIYDDDDQLSVVREALRALDLSEKLHPPRRVLSRISAVKNSGRDPAEAEGDSVGAAQLARISERYRAALDAAHALDFDDLLLRAVQLLESHEPTRESYRRRFRYVLVDEYQDTNRTQYDLIRLLTGSDGNLTVVGDEDQSIYAWRGATISNILDFERDFPAARVLRLEENYRSSQAILDSASGVVARNRKRKGKTLRAVKDGGEPVRLHVTGDEYQEAAWVVEQIAANRGNRAAVLYRMNAQSRLFEEALLRLRLPYVVVGALSFYARKEVKDLLAYLRLVLNPRDAVSLRRVLNVPPRGIGTKTETELERLADARGITLWEALEAAVDDSLLPARATLPLGRFRETLASLRAEAEQLDLKGLVSRILEVTGYSAALAQDDSSESQDRLENLAELLRAASDYEMQEPSSSLAGFLDRVSLLSDTDAAFGEAPVVLMTLHSAKGLEFESVFLVGMEEGLVPHSRSTASEDSLEEERRLCYVGMTRAMDRLFLTRARTRQVFGQRRIAEASRFLDEIPRQRLKISGLLGEGPAPARTGDWPHSPRAQSEARPSPDAPIGSLASTAALRPGTRVRHPLFGVGTVLRAEGSGDDCKVTVSFPGLGAKRLVARYAGLEPV